MTNKWKGVFADPVEPVRMRHPFNLQLFKKYFSFFLHLRWLLLKIVKDDTVINSFYFGLLSLIHIIQFLSLLDEFSKTNHLNAEVIFDAIKVNPGLLLFGKYFKQDHIFRRLLTDNDSMEFFNIGFAVVTPEICLKILRHIKMFPENIVQ